MKNTNLSAITNKVEDIKIIMHENIECATENCVKLENLDKKAEELMKDAGVFQINAKKLKNKMWWKNAKMWSIIVSIIIIIIIILACVIYSYNSNNTTQ